MVTAVGWLQAVIESGTDGMVRVEDWGVTFTDDFTGAVIPTTDTGSSEIAAWIGTEPGVVAARLGCCGLGGTP
jgi:hypothetical protein